MLAPYPSRCFYFRQVQVRLQQFHRMQKVRHA